MWLEWFRGTLVIVILEWSVHGKPTIDKQLAGPCADAADPMACLHGILMHGDKNKGETHEAEDAYLKFRSNLAAGAKVKVGPSDAEEMFHGVLMHGDDEANIAHEHKDTAEVKPENPTKINLPQDIEDYMHGVLMHGDDEPGIDHKKDHQKLKQDEGQGSNVPKGPDDLDNMMHKLMHIDGNTTHDHEKDGGQAAVKGTEDLDDMMHKLMHKDGDISHDLEKEHDTDVDKGPADLNDMMHKLMHADGDISHDEEKNGDKKHDSQSIKGTVADMDDMMHRLMHKDGDISHDHEKEHDTDVDKGPADLNDMMHKLMHADGDISHDDEKNGDKKHDSQSIKGTVADMDDMMHRLMHNDGDISHEHEKDGDLGSEKADGPVDLEDMMHKMMHKDGDTSHSNDNNGHDQLTGKIGPNSDDLHGMLMHGDKETGHVHEHTSRQRPFKMDKYAIRNLNIDEDILKSVGLESILQDLEDYDQWKKNNAKKVDAELDDISDNILSDIESMKRRYLKRAREIDPKKITGITEKEALDHMEKTSGHEHLGDDATHNLELIGSTGPISERHKVFKEGKSSDDL